MSNGELPSYQLQVIVELTRVLRGASDSATVWDEAKAEVISAIQKQSETFEQLLKPFVTKMSDITFADSDCAVWTKQFRAYEIEPRFKKLFASIGPDQESAGGRGEVAPKRRSQAPHPTRWRLRGGERRGCVEGGGAEGEAGGSHAANRGVHEAQERPALIHAGVGGDRGSQGLSRAGRLLRARH